VDENATLESPLAVFPAGGAGATIATGVNRNGRHHRGSNGNGSVRSDDNGNGRHNNRRDNRRHDDLRRRRDHYNGWDRDLGRGRRHNAGNHEMVAPSIRTILEC
jgi:hypothetical protein